MRTIKFRAWDKKRDRMRGVMDIKWFNNGDMRVNATENDDNYEPLLFMNNYDGAILQEFALMQFTGLTDKNGIELFFDDIVDILIGNKFDNRFVVCDLESLFELTSLQINFGATFEVIGNIYENPDLY